MNGDNNRRNGGNGYGKTYDRSNGGWSTKRHQHNTGRKLRGYTMKNRSQWDTPVSQGGAKAGKPDNVFCGDVDTTWVGATGDQKNVEGDSDGGIPWTGSAPDESKEDYGSDMMEQ